MRVSLRVGLPAEPALARAGFAPDRRQVDAALHVVVLQGVRLLTGWLAVLFLAFIPFDWFFTIPAQAGRAAAVLDLAVGGAMAAFWLAVRAGWVDERRANAAAAAMAVLVLPYLLLNTWLTGLPVQSVGIALWQIGICLIVLSWPWAVGMVILSNVAWAAVVLPGLHVGQIPPSGDWVQYGYVLASSSVIGLVAHGVRLRTYRRLEGLRLQEQARYAELEKAQAVARDVEAVRRLNVIKTQFINTAAHELATPMTPIMLQLHVIRQAIDAKGLTEAERRSWDTLERNLQRLRALLQDVLDSARIQADRLPMTESSVDAARVVADAAAEYKEAARAKGVTLALQVAPQLRVVADPKRIHQVVANFLSNAVKFTQAGGAVSVTASQRDGHVRVAVSDSGLGLRPADAARLFAPFVQVHPDATVGGTGLGLYISKGIIENSRGTIGCHSEGPGTGATFWFELPLHPESSPDA